MKIGVCLFDEPTSGQAGWISIAGSRAARISSPAELRSDVFWVTNVDYSSFLKLNLNHSTNIGYNSYFRTPIASLTKELTASEDPEYQCKLLSKVLNRVSELGSYYFGAEIDGSYRYSNILQGCLVKNQLRQQPKGDHELEIVEAIKQSTQNNQAMTSKQFAKGSKLESFVFPRASYAKWLLSQDYPLNGGKWEKLGIGDNKVFGYEDGVEIKNTKHFIEKLKDYDRTHAVFFKISVLSISPNYATFAKFGSGERKYIRHWATLPELMDILRYSKVEVVSAFKTPKVKINVNEELFEETGCEYSISKGLLLENVWTALATPIHSKQNENVSALGAYMRAYDRIACGRAAAAFSRYGYTVGSYGTGRVQVSLRVNEAQGAKEIAISNKLAPSMRFIV